MSVVTTAARVGVQQRGSTKLRASIKVIGDRTTTDHASTHAAKRTTTAAVPAIERNAMTRLPIVHTTVQVLAPILSGARCVWATPFVVERLAIKAVWTFSNRNLDRVKKNRRICRFQKNK